MANDERSGGEAADREAKAVADRLLLRMAWRCRHWAVLLAIVAITGAVADTLLPAVIGHTVDVMLHVAAPPGEAAGRHGLTLSQVGSWMAGCLIVICVIVTCSAVGQLATGMSTAAATEWLRRRLTGHVFACGLGLTERFPVGDLVSRVTGGAADAGYAPASSVLAIAAVIPSAGSIIALGLIDPWLAVSFAAGLPLLAIILRSFVRSTSDLSVRYQQAQGAITARLLEALQGARTIAAAGTREQETARVLIPLAEVSLHGRAFWRIQARIAAQGSLAVPLLQVLVVGVAGIELAAHRISPGELLAASQYAVLGAGVGASVSRLTQLARARAGARRTAEPLAEPVQRRGTTPLPPGRGCLQLCQVTLRHRDELVLDGVDLTVPGGAVVAVVGRSGSGKSLLAALAGRLLDPEQGEVRLDGVSLARLDHAALRHAIVYAFARPALLGRTPREAVAFGISHPSAERVDSAMRDARAWEFLHRLPAGPDTLLAEAPMSGGEVQRIGLARAFAHAGQARLLIMDDAMSSLDTVTEMQVSRALTGRLDGRTCLIIAHRAATAARADLVAWLDGGKLRALAPHHDLWQDTGYRSVFAAETAGTAADG
jgi:ATP-binding cassette subfamily B protein